MQLQLNSKMPNCNIKTDENQITVQQDGDYEIFYRAKIVSSKAAKFAVAVRKNYESIPASIIEQTTLRSSNEDEHVAETTNLIITSLSANDIVDLAITPIETSSDATITIPKNGDIVLVIKKLNTAN